MPLLLEEDGGKVRVYRYVNKHNGKSYVGITTRPKERHHEHFSKSSCGSVLYSAYLKYGISGFEYQILEEVENWKEACTQEKKYIIEFDSYRNGYNNTKGGQGRLGHVGEKCPASKLVESVVEKIISDPCTETEAARKYGTTRKNIDAIRKGRSWPHMNRSGAPAYRNNNHGTKIPEKLAKQIIMDSCSHKTASIKYQQPIHRIKDVRKGKSWRKLDRINVPIYITYREEVRCHYC